MLQAACSPGRAPCLGSTGDRGTGSLVAPVAGPGEMQGSVLQPKEAASRPPEPASLPHRTPVQTKNPSQEAPPEGRLQMDCSPPHSPAWGRNACLLPQMLQPPSPGVALSQGGGFWMHKTRVAGAALRLCPKFLFMLPWRGAAQHGAWSRRGACSPAPAAAGLGRSLTSTCPFPRPFLS